MAPDHDFPARIKHSIHHPHHCFFAAAAAAVAAAVVVDDAQDLETTLATLMTMM